MTKIIIGLVLATSILSGCSKPLVVGAARMEQVLEELTDKRVGVLVNHTSRVGGVHLVDTLLTSGVSVVKIFSPEHGFRGKTPDGEIVNDSIDTETELPIVSLYGKHKKPMPEDLADVDVVIFDIQDVGARFYTYISTLHYLMEACAENGKRVVVLDRPNPNGHIIDGPILEPKFSSFVGMHPIPVAHGLTVGELATMINGEGWLKGKIACDLKVIAMENYSHDMSYQVPVKPSPNLPNDHAIALYPSLCLLEGTVISVGRGTRYPFEWIGHPDLKDQPFQFAPVSIPDMSKYPPHENQMCYGIDITKVPVKNALDLSYVIDFYNLFPDKENYFTDYFEKLAGTETLREQIQLGWSEEKIKATWKDGLDQYENMRNNYLLYP